MNDNRSVFVKKSTRGRYPKAKGCRVQWDQWWRIWWWSWVWK